MKTKFLFIGLSIFLTIGLKAQSNLIVTSNNEQVRFYVMIDGTQMNTFYETWVHTKNLSAGWHKIRIVFENDTVADVTDKLNLTKGQQRTMVITPKSKIMKAMSAEGRGIGKFYHPEKHDSTFVYLRDMYYLELDSRENVQEFGSEVEVDTDKSLSTSITPAAKDKVQKDAK